MRKTTKTKRAAKASVHPITSPAADEHKILWDATQTAAAAKLDLSNLNLMERAFLATCQDIYRNDTGCFTPFERFFLDIVNWVMWGNTPTLESIRHHLAAEGDSEFVRNWDDMLHGVKRFINNYPELIPELQEAKTEQPAEAAHA